MEYHCMYCDRFMPPESFNDEAECAVCQGLHPGENIPVYRSAADLAEDFGVFFPEEEGYVYVPNKGWSKHPKAIAEAYLD